MWRIVVDETRCVGSATCLAVAPGRFALNEHDHSVPADTLTEPDDAVRDAADLCPTGAIRIEPVPAPSAAGD